MKKNLFLIFAFLFVITSNLYSQSGWFWQNPTPQGNGIMAIKMFDANSGIFVNADNILRTENGGQGWEQIYTGFPWFNKSISMVNGNTYYILADTSIIIKTTNKGASWKYISNKPVIKNSFIYFKDENTGFAVNKIGGNNYSSIIHRTTNGGTDWQNVISNDSILITSVKFINTQTGYASGSKYANNIYKTKIFKTINGGSTWDTVSNSFRLQSSIMYFTDENTGYLCGSEGSASPRTYKTTNGGQTWNTHTQLSTAIYQLQFLDEMTGFAVSGNRMYITSNGGTNWAYSTLSIDGINYTMDKIFFSNINTGYVSGGSGIILKTTNSGGNWVKIAGNNVLNDDFWSMSFSDNNTGFIIGYYNKLLRTTNGGSNWQILQFDANLAFSAISYVNSNTWYVTAENGKVLKTTNTGSTWDTSYANVYNPTRVEFVNEQTGYGVCKYSNFIKTTNGGINWLVTSPFSAQNWAMDFIDANTGFAGSDGGRLYKTTDAGNSWTRTDPNPHDFYINDVQFINYNTGYIGTSYGYAGNGVLKTTNGGINWIPSLTGTGISDINFLNERTGFAINASEVYKTTNGGNNWYRLRTCSSNGNRMMHFSDSLTGWIIGYNGMIIKTTNGGESVTFEPPVEIPTSFYLFQNYPNPFNPVTTIRYGLPKDLSVKIKIFDILGSLVTQLVNENQTAGNYSVNFNGSAYASGVYFYTIETPEFTQSKKMVLLK